MHKDSAGALPDIFYSIIRNTAFLVTVILVSSCTPSREYLIRNQHQISSMSQEVRVLITKTSDNIIVSSSSKIRISDKKTGKITYNDSGNKIIFRPEKINAPVMIESWNEPLRINGNPYRGYLELHNVLGKMYVVNVLKMDEYLYGVVPAEMPVSWNAEALKAQAIAARTYAIYHIERNKNALYDLDATTKFQVYNGFSVEDTRTNHAVQSTSGEIGVFKHKPILSYFHSTCGGTTINDKYVWEGNDLPYLEGIRCPFCKESPKYSWHDDLSVDEIKHALRKEYNEISRIKGVSFKKINGRVVSVVVRHDNGRIKLTGNQFRLLVSPRRIRSLYFTAKKTKQGLAFNGHGWGHGVGMCQYGAKGMAEKGVQYKDILKYYYTGIDIVNINNKKNTPGSAVVSRSSIGSKRTPN
ncbi:MAG TPA: SpoIID/LytB domain-containing protein [Spirochaetota bacterium]|nr:SpoIID/LytB domain-containing protein [Spirochaetota bacterium]